MHIYEVSTLYIPGCDRNEKILRVVVNISIRRYRHQIDDYYQDTFE